MSEIILQGTTGVIGNYALLYVSYGQELRDEVSAWVTLIGSVAITLTTIGLQIYRLIRDRDKDRKTNKPADAEKKDKENDKRNG